MFKINPQIICLFLLTLQVQMFGQRNDCNIDLFKDNYLDLTKTSTKIAYLKIIDKDHYKRIQEGVDTGASIVLEGIPISGYGNYEQFEEARSNYFESLNIDYSQKTFQAVVKNALNYNGLKAYEACINSGCSNLSIWVTENISPSSATLYVKWNAPSGESRKLKYLIEEKGLQNFTRTSGEISPNSAKSFMVNRVEGEDLRVTIQPAENDDPSFSNLTPDAVEYFHPGKFIELTTIIEDRKSKDKFLETHPNGNNGGQVKETRVSVLPKEGFEIIPESVGVIYSTSPRNDAGGNSLGVILDKCLGIFVDYKSKDKIDYRLAVCQTAKEHGTQLGGYIIWKEKKTIIKEINF